MNQQLTPQNLVISKCSSWNIRTILWLVPERGWTSTCGLFEVGLGRLVKEASSMASNTPVEMARHASTASILWGVLLIVFGAVAVGVPFLAAVAVSALVAWLIVLAGVVHIMLAFRA